MTTQSKWGEQTWGGESGNQWGGSTSLLHYYALKKIFPIQDLQGSFDDNLKIQGKYLDQVFYQNDLLLANEFPDTATNNLSLPSFERIFNVNTQAEVLAAEISLVNKNGKLNPNFFVQLGNSMGYTDVTITEGITDAFIIGDYVPPASVLPHVIHSINSNWTWTISSTMIPVGNARTTWENLIKTKAPAWTKIIFEYL